MRFFKKRIFILLSEYIDKELTSDESLDMSEKLAFNGELRTRASDYLKVDSLVAKALTPPRTPDPPPTISIDPVVRAHNPNTSKNRWRPALVATVGFAATAGIALIGLHRKGFWRGKNV